MRSIAKCARRVLVAAALSIAFSVPAFSQEIIGKPGESQEQRDARMKWWREARFGMFIHWGVYSVPAGTYKGKQVPGIDRKSTRLNSSHRVLSRMPSSA